MRPEDRFQILNHFLGFGNPHAQFWFIGLEEAGEWKNPQIDQDIERYKNPIMSEDAGPKRDNTQVYAIMSKIILFSKRHKWDGWQAHRNNSLLIKEGEAFQANLFPIGKSTFEEWPYSREAFGFKTLHDYVQHVRASDRFKILYTEWLKRFELKEEYSEDFPLITLCFGKKEWSTFQAEWRLKEAQRKKTESWYQVYEDKRLILCPFFSEYKKNNMFPETRLITIAEEVSALLSS